MNTGHTNLIVELAGALTSLSLAFPAIAGALPAPDIEDIPGVDDRLTRKPSLSQIYSVAADVRKRSGFNDETAGYAIGWAMATSCPEHLEAFEAIWGEELV